MFRAMLRGLLAHKLRLLLSALAVVLGTMFMSGAFIGGDTIARGFDQLFATVNANLDVRVTVKDTAPGSNDQVTAVVDEAAAARVRAVPGVKVAVPQVTSDGARVVGTNGKVVGTSGAPRLGTGWVPEDPTRLAELRQGRPPRAPDEIAVNAQLADDSGYHVGDRVDVITLRPRQTFTLVGVFGYPGDRGSLGGESTVAFTVPVAQQLMLGRPGYSSVDVQAASGTGADALKRRIADALGSGYVVRTGAETAKDQASDVSGVVNGLKIGLTVFALIGLFTGAFLIFNTFSMLVAQRTRELALYRAFGAGRGQVNRAVLLEASLLGLGSAIVGLVLGVGVGWLLKTALTALSHTDLPVNGVVLRPYVVFWTLVVGVVFTVAAALVPALRASRVPPVAAMREATVPDKPLRRLTLAGAAVFGVGVLLLALKLTGTVKGQLALLLGGGALLAFLGVAMLAPSVSRPVTGTVGRVFARSMPGRLGVGNTGRNPRRTAVTAAALMIGVALATGAGVFASSAKAGINKVFDTDLHAQLAVSTDPGAGAGTAGFDPALVTRIREIPGVQTALALRQDTVRLGGETEGAAATDIPAAEVIIDLRAKDGQLRALGPGEMVVDEDLAKKRGWSVGTTVPMQAARGEFQERLVAIYATNKIASGPMVSEADAAGFRSPVAQQGFVKVTGDDRVAPVRRQLDALFADNPEVTVSTADALAKRSSGILDVLLVILNVLLGLTIVVAVLGVLNTLLLSIYERTREIGLIRAIGMSRGQVSRMITVESVLISVFGALLGIAVGVALGIAIVAALHSGGFLVLTIPWGYLVVTLGLAVVAGVLAAILPAIRAARLNVLAAIAYE